MHEFIQTMGYVNPEEMQPLTVSALSLAIGHSYGYTTASLRQSHGGYSTRLTPGWPGPRCWCLHQGFQASSRVQGVLSVSGSG